METNWNAHFCEALVEHIRLSMNFEDKDHKEDYRQELKQLIWEAVSHGTKDFLEEYYNDLIKVMAKELIGVLQFSFDTKYKG